MEAPSTGTTIIAVSYAGGVVLGADSRVSMGAYISNRASDKPTPLTENIWLLRSGSAADTQAIADYVRQWADQLSSELDEAPTVKAVVNLVKQISYNNKQLMGALIVAGWDRIAGGQVYCVPVGGTVVQEAWAADGSGSTFLLGLMDSRYRDNMTQEAAEELASAALAHAMGRDGSSGGVIRLVTCSQSGSKRKWLTGDCVLQTWDEKLVQKQVVST